ncbi:alpha-galactosidase [Leeia sp.]|uniref:alpha-galactosidase n=1 Tax=Leeia sp. TaxID=2884678 RepID=UPI0035B23DFD
MRHAELKHLQGRHMSLVLEASADGPPRWRQIGARLTSVQAFADWPLDAGRALPGGTLASEGPHSVLPCHGMGWFEHPALAGSRPQPGGGDQDWAHHFHLSDWQQQGNRLTLHLLDTVAQLSVRLCYTLAEDCDVLVAHAELENQGALPFRVDWLAALCVPLPASATEVLTYTGLWAAEFQEVRQRLGTGCWRRDNRRGRTSSNSFPGLIVGQDLHEDEGAVWGVHLGWSGNHSLLVESLQDGQRQLQLGAWFAPGEHVLAPGERYRTPTAYLSFSPDGLNGLSANFHQYVRKHLLAWPGQAMTPRPVHLNTWEAVYFDHQLDDLQQLAQAAAEVGVERFVLDDGWFHRRQHDRAALGDWWPDEQKYPDGLSPLIEHVRNLGMQFGLWVEPEMVSPDSELYRQHPEWALQLAGRPLVMGRNQLVLDLSRDAVFDYLFATLDQLLSQYPICYLKWDMNRDLATAGHDGCAAYHAQTEALYRLLGQLRASHPEVEIESCASGGSRADYGILAHAHRIWASDCIDARSRLRIQQGFLRFFPPELMGAHIGASPAHTTGRQHRLDFRAAVTFPGHLGLEMDIRTLSAEERHALKVWISHYKQWRDVLHGGVLQQGSLHDALQWWQVTRDDQCAAILGLYRLDDSCQRHAPVLALSGLDRSLHYRLTLLTEEPVPTGNTSPLFQQMQHTGLVLSGEALCTAGLPIPPMYPESALLIGIQAIDPITQPT